MMVQTVRVGHVQDFYLASTRAADLSRPHSIPAPCEGIKLAGCEIKNSQWVTTTFVTEETDWKRPAPDTNPTYV
jgi:hypothetical protein